MYSMNLHHHNLILGAIIVSGVLLAGYALYSFIFRFFLRRTGADGTGKKPVLRHLRQPARWIFLTAAALVAFPYLALPQKVHVFLHHTVQLLFIASLAWVAIACMDVVEDILLRRYDITQENNIQARRVHTQMRVVRRIFGIFIVVLALGMMLYTFDNQLAKYGAGLLASAGVASLVLATAAKSSASNILAGLQIAFTEPIRINDVVVVEGENGRIEEITTTYVVVRVWDLRRLIVPLSYFIEKPFQNWTRESSDLMGTAFVYVDYDVPVENLRAELQQIVKSTPLWDTKVCALQVTDLTDRSLELRCLVSARSSSELFDLRCHVREQMIQFIRDNYPHSFPLQRREEWAMRTDDPAKHGT
ncbi:MAG TPA: mechanosensitive ion channel domain-containing protein [Acidobacteriaceae bacterium]|nr:mechanosensitive ion channel domain-containing protein [Acidobacteriaceae bacterium]